jgi:hypothetical protein
MSQNLTTVFEMAERHQLEVNAGLVNPDNAGINTLSFDVLPRKTPLLVVSDEIYVVGPEDGAIVVKDPYRYDSATGGYRGFSWVIERSEHDMGAIDRLVLGALTKNVHNDTMLWTPVESIKVWDIYEELKDDRLAQDIIVVLSATDSSVDVQEFLRLCDLIPGDNETLTNLFLALINSCVRPDELFSSVRAYGTVEEFEKYSFVTGTNSHEPISYPIKKGDIFAFDNQGGRRKLSISRRFSEKQIREKNVIVSSDYGFDRAN